MQGGGEKKGRRRRRGAKTRATHERNGTKEATTRTTGDNLPAEKNDNNNIESSVCGPEKESASTYGSYCMRPNEVLRHERLLGCISFPNESRKEPDTQRERERENREQRERAREEKGRASERPCETTTMGIAVVAEKHYPRMSFAAFRHFPTS
jgi:hypothetical protein